MHSLARKGATQTLMSMPQMRSRLALDPKRSRRGRQAIVATCSSMPCVAAIEVGAGAGARRTARRSHGELPDERHEKSRLLARRSSHLRLRAALARSPGALAQTTKRPLLHDCRLLARKTRGLDAHRLRRSLAVLLIADGGSRMRDGAAEEAALVDGHTSPASLHPRDRFSGRHGHDCDGGASLQDDLRGSDRAV
jgi:hypothetical protein